jgi:sRNA-binding regulator protein Hfq
MQDSILSTHFGSANPPASQGFDRGLTRFEITPGFALTVNGAELEALAGDSRVITIQENRLLSPTLNQSVPLIGMNQAYAAGATGAGWAVAVLDTGVQLDHEFLANKIIAQACFSANNGNPGAGRVSLCPNGAATQIGAPAANAETPQCISGNNELCDHGTHVAGIAAGFNTNLQNGEPINGVAKNGFIWGIQVFTRFNLANDCSPEPAPCVLAFTSDTIRALDHVFTNMNSLPNGIKVASVNMSLGGGFFSGTCDTDGHKPGIDRLRNVGVLTAIASGNDGFTNGVGSPGCISTAVTVGSSTKTDVISSFSNMSPVVDLMAPGTQIQSSIPVVPHSTTTYAFFNGTSMATPHVAGAIAAMRTVCPTATADTIANALKSTGTSIVDNRPGGTQTKPRIRVDLAIQACVPAAPPPPPPQVACTFASPLGDFNGDGRDDLLLRRLSDGLLAQYLLNGFQILNAQALGAVGTDWTLTAVADFNGDGRADLLFRRSDGTFSIYLLNGTQIIDAQIIGQVDPAFAFAGAADFNGDGRADILFRRDSDGMLALSLIDGFQVLSSQLLGAVGPDFRVRGVRDFNGDGRADILFRRASDGMLSLYLFNGFTNIGAQLLGIVGLEWNLLGVRDFNGDGRADLLFRRASDGMLSLYLLNGFTIIDAQLLGAVGLDMTLLGVGDVNGDGRSDLVFRRNSDGLLAIYLLNGFQLLDAQAIGTVGTDLVGCFGQPPLSVALTTAGGGSTP